MRAIKFRGWNGKEIIKEVFTVKVSPESEHQGIRIPKQCVFSWSMSSLQDVMQFTGLLDKNGVEIYEGDIVEFESDFTDEKTNHLVKYFDNQDYPAFDLSPSISDDMNGFSSIVYQGIGSISVIGNIHETPELLK